MCKCPFFFFFLLQKLKNMFPLRFYSTERPSLSWWKVLCYCRTKHPGIWFSYCIILMQPCSCSCPLCYFYIAILKNLAPTGLRASKGYYVLVSAGGCVHTEAGWSMSHSHSHAVGCQPRICLCIQVTICCWFQNALLHLLSPPQTMVPLFMLSCT